MSILQELDTDFRKAKFQLLEINESIINTATQIRIASLFKNPKLAEECNKVIHLLQKENEEIRREFKSTRDPHFSGTLAWHRN